MARIPMGNFGNRVAAPQQAANIPAGAFVDGTGQALQQAGNTLAGIGQSLHDDQQRLARARAANSALDYEVQVSGVVEQLKTQLSDGTLPYDGAAEALRKAMGEVPRPSTKGLDDVAAEEFSGLLNRTEVKAASGLATAARTAQRAEFKGQADTAIDSLAKLAGQPGADIEQINARIDAFDQLGQFAYGAGWAKVKQDFRDRNWFNQATQKAMASRENLDSLRQMEHSLTASDGFYVNRLDTDKRNAVLRTVQADRIRLENKLQVSADRRETRAERAVADIDKQIASGIAATTDQWLTWQEQAKGTPFEQDVRNRMKEEAAVQQLMSRPIAEQIAYVRERESTLKQQGGSLRDQQNLQRVASAVNANIETLSNNPLEYAKQRAGIDVPLLDLRNLADPDGVPVIGAQIRERVTTIRALQEKNPGLVHLRPLLPEEATMLSTALSAGDAKQKAGMLGTLYQVFGDSQAFEGAMAQINGTSPFMARVGVRASSYAQAQLTNNWVDRDIVQSAGDVAAIALHGDELIRNGGKSGTISFPMPKDAEFINELRDKVGDLYRGAGPGDSGGNQFTQDAYMVKAYYVGLSAQEGDVSGEVNQGRLDRAIMATLGQPVDFHGNGRVLAPWGMSESSFLARANRAVFQELSSRGLQQKLGRSMSSTGLIGIGAGTYAVTLAGLPVRDPATGQLILISMVPDEDAGRDSFGRRLSDQIPNTPAQPAVDLQPGLGQPAEAQP